MTISSVNPQTQARRREVIREAIQEGDWLRLHYGGEDRVVIPQRLQQSSAGKELLRGVLAESSEPRTFRTDRIEKMRRLPDSDQDPTPQVEQLARHNEGIARLQQAIEREVPVRLEYHLPRLGKAVSMTVDPERFDIQPDKSLALEAITERGNQRSFRLDRICFVDFE
jgi:predicted DNA-binding transcriptional regulator YafY